MSELELLPDCETSREFVRYREFENMRRGGRWFTWYVIEVHHEADSRD